MENFSAIHLPTDILQFFGYPRTTDYDAMVKCKKLEKVINDPHKPLIYNEMQTHDNRRLSYYYFFLKREIQFWTIKSYKAPEG